MSVFLLVHQWRAMKRNDSQLIIFQDGVILETGAALIPWEEIQYLYMKEVKKNPYLCIKVPKPGRYMKHLSVFSRLLLYGNWLTGLTPLTVGMGGLSPSASEVWESIKFKRPDKIME